MDDFESFDTIVLRPDDPAGGAICLILDQSGTLDLAGELENRSASLEVWAPNVTVRTGGGADAIWAHSGTNALFGGTGNERRVVNTLTGGAAAFDTIADFPAADGHVIDLSDIIRRITSPAPF